MDATVQWHIQQLRQNVPAAQMVGGKETRWSIQLVAPSMEPICSILVELSREFPQRKPHVTVQMSRSAYCRHAWVDSEGVVTGSQLLNEWEKTPYNQRNLGYLVASIMGEFAARPPQAAQALPTQNVIKGSVINKPKRTVMPQIPPTCSSLDGLTEEELEYYEKNQQAADDLFADSEIVQKYKTILAELYETNKKHALTNKEMESTIISEQETVREKDSHLKKRKAEVDALLAQQNEVTKRFNTEHLIQELKTIANKAEKECEEYSENVLEGVQPLSKKDFLQRKRNLHRILAQKEKLHQMGPVRA